MNIRVNQVRLAFFVTLLLLGGGSARAQEAPVDIVLPEAYELANVILALTEYGRSDPWEVRRDFPYYDDVRTYFSPYLHHPLLAAVNYSRERWREYLSFRTDAFAFVFNDDGRLERATDFRTHADLSPFDDHLDLINDFVRASGFRTFFADHAEYYRSIVDGYSDYYMIDSILSFLRRYVGPEVSGEKRHVVVLSPLVYRMNAHRPIDDITSGDFPTLSDYLVGKGDDHPDAKTRAIDIHTLFTEMDHGFVNPVSASFALDIATRFDYRSWQREGTGYESDIETFNEYMTWALYDVFVDTLFPEHAAEVSLYWHFQNKSRGFVYSALFGGKLNELRTEQSSTAGLPDLYPAILDWIAEAQRHLSLPVVTSPTDSLAVACGVQDDFSLEFSEAMVPTDSFTAILWDGKTRLDTLLITRTTNDLQWSPDARRVAFRLTIPAVANPNLVLNWWGGWVALRGRTGVLLRSPTAIQLICK